MCQNTTGIDRKKLREVSFDEGKATPGVKPPWGHLAAVNLDTGEFVWKQTIGHYPGLKGKGVHIGTENFGSSVATAGGVLFIAATREEKIRGFSKLTGELLWEDPLAVADIATPTGLSHKWQGIRCYCLRWWRQAAD